MTHDDDGRGGLVPVGDIPIDALGDRRSRCHPTHTRPHRWHTGRIPTCLTGGEMVVDRGGGGKVHESRGGDISRGRPVGGPGDRAGLPGCAGAARLRPAGVAVARARGSERHSTPAPGSRLHRWRTPPGTPPSGSAPCATARPWRSRRPAAVPAQGAEATGRDGGDRPTGVGGGRRAARWAAITRTRIPTPSRSHASETIGRNCCRCDNLGARGRGVRPRRPAQTAAQSRNDDRNPCATAAIRWYLEHLRLCCQDWTPPNGPGTGSASTIHGPSSPSRGRTFSSRSRKAKSSSNGSSRESAWVLAMPASAARRPNTFASCDSQRPQSVSDNSRSISGCVARSTGRARALLRRDRLCAPERAAVEQIRRDTRGPEGVAIGRRSWRGPLGGQFDRHAIQADAEITRV